MVYFKRHWPEYLHDEVLTTAEKVVRQLNFNFMYRPDSSASSKLDMSSWTKKVHLRCCHSLHPRKVKWVGSSLSSEKSSVIQRTTCLRTPLLLLSAIHCGHGGPSLWAILRLSRPLYQLAWPPFNGGGYVCALYYLKYSCWWFCLRSTHRDIQCGLHLHETTYPSCHHPSPASAHFHKVASLSLNSRTGSKEILSKLSKLSSVRYNMTFSSESPDHHPSWS